MIIPLFSMNFGDFLYIQQDNIEKQVGNIENLEKKLANTRVSIVFNKTCLNENLLPTFTNIYIGSKFSLRYIILNCRCNSNVINFLE